jgi:SAM-dependent methyltransferase
MSDATRTFRFGFSGEPQLLDTTALAVRIAASYRVAAAEFAGHGDSMWATFSAQQAPVIEAIRNNDIVSLGRLLADPSSNDFLWGYDDLLKTFTEIRMQHPDQAENGARPIYDALVQVGIGIGAIPCPYPEGGQGNPEPPIEVLLQAIDAVFGFKVDFPNPFKMNFGLETSRGIASVRAVQAIYQAWRINQILRYISGKRVLEIGAGLGRNAYYARKFGIVDYTIVDIPTTQIAQGYFLSRVCAETEVSMYGEPPATINLRSPDWVRQTDEQFDLILNVDSLTEMDPAVARRYIKFARDRARAFLSINHEVNPVVVRDLFREIGIKPVGRSPYWPRAGYVEELVLQLELQRGSKLLGPLARFWRRWACMFGNR